jgi:hypothetical protein
MFEFIEKIAVEISICMSGEEPLPGHCWLLPQSRDHLGPETLFELLNSGTRIVPLVVPERSETVLLNRLDINWVMVGREVKPELICPPNYLVTHEETVHITFRDGRTLVGVVQMEQPEGMNRVSDFLNLSDDYFPLRAANGSAVVNKSQVRAVRLIAPSPQPVAIRDLRR